MVSVVLSTFCLQWARGSLPLRSSSTPPTRPSSSRTSPGEFMSQMWACVVVCWVVCVLLCFLLCVCVCVVVGVFCLLVVCFCYVCVWYMCGHIYMHIDFFGVY